MRTLLTWSDRGAGPVPDHHGPRPAADRGPVMRLLELGGRPRYDRVLVLVPASGLPGARRLADEAGAYARVELRLVELTDPSDHAQLFNAIGPLADELRGDEVEVVLSAGTPQAQTLWVILVTAGLLRATMLQVVPARFVPDPHPAPVREVHLPIDGFPEIRALREEVVRLRAEAGASRTGLVGDSPPMRELRARLARVAPTEVPVLVHGETGTGKELVARAVHAGSRRASSPFVACNAGSLDDGLSSSELFGHEAGAFTGAASRRRGLFELAHGGTLFLDEVGDLSPRVQVGLLRALQEGEIRRLGGESAVRVDVRVVAATHRDLRAAVRAGAFREDLYYRLCGATLTAPPLRDRPEDLPALVARFLDEAGRPGLPVRADAWDAALRYRWPGNVRELRAEVVRWTVFADREVTRATLSPELAGAGAPSTGAIGVGTLAGAVEAAERAAVAAAWASTGGNVAATARVLDVDRNTVKRKLRAHGLR
ncbi:MAG: sigma 54-interacting transcriptional regulator [Myxococcota bacterium]